MGLLDCAPLAARLRPTTWIAAPRLAERLGLELVLATESFQYTGSFKFRAAGQVAASVAATTLIGASSGNFGQGLAAACRLLGKRAVVVMPTTSAEVKVAAVREHGGEVVFVDTQRQSRAERVREVAAAHPGCYVASAYDDPLVIAGNATLGDELARGPFPFEALLAPVGGGGLTSGLLTGLRRSGSLAEVWAAEPQLANDAARSLAAGRLIANPSEPQTLADGARTLSLGRHNWEILRGGLAGIIEVPEEAIAEALRLLFALANLKAEPTGALAVGALLADPARFGGRRLCCLVSGGNVDPSLFRSLLAG